MLGGALLVLSATLYERLTRRPFLASLTGHTLGYFLGVRFITKNDYTLLETSRLPAIGFRAVAQTWGEVVLVVKGSRTTRIEAHESAHVAQYRRYTSLGFWLLYVFQWLRGLVMHRDLFKAYRAIGLEEEARAYEARAAQTQGDRLSHER